ncbi:response regulator transcription factor [Rubripirellula reticaptiva]|uniref:Sporulation initiation phosphotransferase F n=1 Tax=Rubripirellula reticaptiva TaxID=2528013 RepID=A0A5C6EC88_9BACT|nr:response regulator [Rubripirellula reticaptiva]TWU46508.1 Sporulation initiation phosphotransferase F [Rubripirellula reticaptiva]
MTSILIVEDDDNKRAKIDEFVRELKSGCEVSHSRSYSSGVDRAIREGPDLLLLDMQMPTFDKSEKEDGGPLRHFAGIHLLRRLRKHGISTRVIVVTGFESFGEGEEKVSLEGLEHRLRDEFPEIFLGIVHLRASESRWQIELKELLLKFYGEKC